jgi:MoxR-like ATPase
MQEYKKNMEMKQMDKIEYIESLKTTNESTPKDRVYKVPTAQIDFDNYLPRKWGVKYIELDDEARELEACMLAGKNYLIEGDKGLGKTQLVHNICVKHNMPIVSLNCSEGTRVGDLIGRPQINEFGSYFQLGVLPTVIEVANHFGKALLYLDEFNALAHEIQKATNSVTDDRREISANGKIYRLNDGVKLSVVATMNPSTYAGVNTLTEDARSRFIGSIWEYPSSDNLRKIIDWRGIPDDTVIAPLMTLTQNIHNLRLNADVEYSLSPRDLAQFTECYRMWSSTEMKKPLERSIKNSILSKFSDPAQRELVKKQVKEIFGVDV